jgi:hypothetical protein
VHGLPLLSPPPEEVTLTRPPGAARGRTASGTRFLTARLPPGHVTTRYGIPVTTIGRTVVDLARTLPFAGAVAVADAAIHRRTGKTLLAGVLADGTRSPGTDRARRVLAFSDGRAASPLESWARVVFAEHGLPAPDLQTRISVLMDGEYHDYRADFCWEDRKTIVETDGLSKYDSGQRAIDQLKRDRQLRERGYKVVHVTWADLRDRPQVVIERIRRAFAAATAY